MPVSIDWPTKVIYVTQSFLNHVGGTDYELDTEAFRMALKDLEDDPVGMAYVDTHRRNAPATLGGITYAQQIEIINGYTVTFEDGDYSVNLVGSNNNIQDVTNLNGVSIRSQNSAGLVVVTTTGANANEIADAVWSHATAADLLDKVNVAQTILRNKTITDPVSGTMVVYAADGTTPLLTAQLYQDAAGTIPYAGAGAERRERLA